MPKGASVGGGLSIQQMKDAFLLALEEAGDGGGGGGSSETIPDLIVTGTGGYTIPVGFVGKVKANCQNGETFSVNGVTVLSSSSKEIIRISAISYQNANLLSYTVASGYKAHVNFGRYGVPRTDNYITVDIGRVSNTAQGSLGDYEYAESLKGASGTVFKLYDDRPQITGYAERNQNTNIEQDYKLKEGTTISGGRYVVELYAI